ncbi:MAG: hypothetical protein ACP5NF_11780 [Thermoanaerobaculum sp.]
MKYVIGLFNPAVLFLLWFLGKRLGEAGPTWVGIRTAATTASRESWYRAHAEGRPLVGLAAAWALLFGTLVAAPVPWALPLAIIMQVVVFVWLSVASSRFARRKPAPDRGILGELVSDQQLRWGLAFLSFVFFALAVSAPFIAELGPNAWVGNRTERTMRDPALWTLVHHEAVVPTALAGASYLLAWLAVREGLADGWAFRPAAIHFVAGFLVPCLVWTLQAAFLVVHP